MKKQDRIFFLLGTLMLISELWKQWCLTYIVNSGSYDWWYFPFQLCSIPMYLCLILPFSGSGKFHRSILTFLMDFALLGGIFTFFDTSGLHYSYAPLTVHSFAWHILLIILGILAGACNTGFTVKDFRRSVFIYLICCCIATALNLSLSRYGMINMFYISPRYNVSQKVFSQIALLAGNTARILIYILVTITGAGLLHLVWSLIKRQDRSRGQIK